MDTSRRHFLRGRLRPQNNDIRLPWVKNEALFTSGCTRCGDCYSACPQQIIVAGEGGYPTLSFEHNECTFCGKCVTTCKEPLFDNTTNASPWDYLAVISTHCLTHDGIVCQNCKDACEPRAITFQFGGVANPKVNKHDCTGCGACIAPCPNSSINLQHANAPVSPTS
jgi:ferredoxin-type protein NapF